MSLTAAPTKKIYYLTNVGGRMEALPTGALFHQSNARWRLIMGPVGSGKSVTMCQEIFRRASRQKPNAQGIRRTRWAIIRNSYPMLRDTTMKTWLDWFPEQKFGVAKHAPPPEHFLTWDVEEYGVITKVECEVIFRAMDRPDQVKNLLSLELTGAWVNEAREIPKVILDTLDARIGRFPSRQDGGATWEGVFMDTNPYDVDHYLYGLFEGQKLPGYEFWSQPGTENTANLPKNYYENISIGKDPEWVRIYVQGQHGFICDGKPVYPEFRHSLHVAQEPLKPNPHLPIYCGVDFGLTPAMIWTQVDPRGRWLILREDTSTDMGIDRFGEHCLRVRNMIYPDFEFKYYADPAGTQRAQTDEKTCFEILSQKGMDCEPGAIDFTSRREAVAGRLGVLIDGQPGAIIDPSCQRLIKGFMGGYNYPEITGTGRFGERPEKNEYSHPHDALQYVASVLFNPYGNRKKGKKRRKAVSWRTV